MTDGPDVLLTTMTLVAAPAATAVVVGTLMLVFLVAVSLIASPETHETAPADR